MAAMGDDATVTSASTPDPIQYAHSDIASFLKVSQAKCIRRYESRGQKQQEDENSIHKLSSSSDIPELSKSLRDIPNERELHSDLHFNYSDLWTIQAPMVRCSRPPFRKLCRLWGTKINYTHMILADSFTRSAAARESEFAMYQDETRLITQLAGTNGPVMGKAAAMVAPYCDAIDINCGCPQRWAMKEGLGSAMMERPENVADIVKCIRNAMPAIQYTEEEGKGSSSSASMSHIPCVVKMRVYDDVRKSVEFARQVEAAGAGWITVHGRTPWCVPTAKVRTDAIRLIRESVHVPVVANGGVEHPYDAMSLAVDCGVGGVMCATGLLNNPATFYPFEANVDRQVLENFSIGRPNSKPSANDLQRGEKPEPMWSRPPVPVISDFLKLATLMDLPIKATSHHFLMMANDYMTPSERTFVSQQRSVLGLLDCASNLGFLRGPPGKVPLDFTSGIM